MSAESSPHASAHARIAEALIDARSWVTSPAVSPDGQHVAFVVATIDLTGNRTTTQVWIDDAPVSAGDHDGGPAWSPDGRFLAFTARRGEKTGDSTLHALPVEVPGEVRTLCTMPDGLGDVCWSPNGRWLAFTSRTRDERYEAEDASWQSPRKVERFFSRLNGENWVFDRPKHVHVVAADGTGRPRNLTPGPFQHAGLSWLGDSTGLITSAQRHETWDTDLATDLYSVPLEEGAEVRCLTAHDGVYAAPVVSPDGTRVACTVRDSLTILPVNAKVGVLPVDADEMALDAVVWASAGLDRTFRSLLLDATPRWESDESLLAVAEDRGDAHLYRLDASGARPPQRVTEGPLTVTSLDVAGGTIATARTTIERPAELYVGDERRTSVADRLATRLLPWEKYTVATTDGTDEIDCWIMRPAGFDEDSTYPVLLNVHGGPFSQYGEFFFDEAQMQAAAGFVVVLGNPRGGSGRDSAWGQAILGPKHPERPGSGWGGVDVDDVLAILDGALERHRFCDRDRVGMLGGSYGGFMATWLAAHHGERFRAICSERAVNNLVSEEWSSDIATVFRAEHGMSHVDDEEEYVRMSPVRAADAIDTPMLIIHAEEDWRCPIAQAEELWVALKLRGKDVDFYRFPGENHELSRSGSPVHRVQRAEIILDWFSERLAPPPPAGQD